LNARALLRLFITAIMIRGHPFQAFPLNTIVTIHQQHDTFLQSKQIGTHIHYAIHVQHTMLAKFGHQRLQTIHLSHNFYLGHEKIDKEYPYV
jgi:hypothetical protein